MNINTLRLKTMKFENKGAVIESEIFPGFYIVQENNIFILTTNSGTLSIYKNKISDFLIELTEVADTYMDILSGTRKPVDISKLIEK